MDEVTYTYTQTHMNHIYSLVPMRTNKVLTKAEATEWKEKQKGDIKILYKISKQDKGVKKIH